MVLPSQLELQSIPALIIGLCDCCGDKNEAVTHSTGGRKSDTEAKEYRYKEEDEMKKNECKGKRKLAKKQKRCETDEETELS